MPSSLFLDPLGLLALASVVPLVLLYIFQPDPRTVEVPTLGFLPIPDEEGGSHPVIDRLRRNKLLAIQLTALVLLSLAVASPYVTVSSETYAEETAIVLDASASMAVGEGETRLDAARSAAAGEVTDDTSVVVDAGSPSIEAREATADEAGDAVAGVRQTHSRGDLESAVSQAASLVGDSGRVVVYSDFAGDSDWSQVVEEARSRGVAVELEQFADGGDENVGIVDKSFEEDRVTVTVQSFATSLQDRELSLGDESHEFSIRPGERRSFSFSVPEEGGVAKLSPGDDFAVDDEAYVARYSDGVDALLVSSEEDTAVERGLDSLPNVDLSVDTPPVGSVSDDVDVVVYGEVDASRAVSRTARSARDLTEEGGGAIVTAHDELPDAQDTLSDVMLVDVDGFVEGGEVEVTSNRSLVADVDHDFPAAPEVLDANVTAGDSLLEAGDQPLLVDAEVGDGRLVYYGYVEGATDFDSSYFYPLFWRDLVHHAAGRQPLPAANKRTGATVDVGDQADVPWGSDSGDVVMDEIGFYETSNDVYSASLLDPGESAVEASDVDGSRMAEAAERSQETRNPFDFTPLIIVLALGVIGSELLLLRRRGDL